MSWKSVKLSSNKLSIPLSIVLDDSNLIVGDNFASVSTDDFEFSFNKNENINDKQNNDIDKVDFSELPEWLQERQKSIRNILESTLTENKKNNILHQANENELFEDMSDSEFDSINF